jgi:hypothetical protein
VVPVGSTVIFTYLVTNTGNIGLTLASIIDDNGTPTNPADDIVPTYVSGDTTNPGVLDPGETWLFVVSGTAAAPGVFVPNAAATAQAATNLATRPVSGTGANVSGPYDPSGTGLPSGNGNGGGNATGRPAAGTVGNADTKNPPGQVAKYVDSPDNGYECDGNSGIARSNPAHTGCAGQITYVNTVTVTGTVTLTDGSVLSAGDSDQAGYRTTTLAGATSSTTPITASNGGQGAKSAAPPTPATPTNVPGVAKRR